MPLMMMDHTTDPKIELLEKFKDVDQTYITGPQILIATYVRSNKTKSGIYLTDQAVGEDIYQGKVGLILKMGPQPFDKAEEEYFGERKPQLGDWVVYRASDAFSLNLFDRTGHCRIMDRCHIKLIVPVPDIVW